MNCIVRFEILTEVLLKG